MKPPFFFGQHEPVSQPDFEQADFEQSDLQHFTVFVHVF